MFTINPQLASASVYRLLNKNECDIQSVICSFVLLNYLDWGQLSFTSAGMSDLLKENSSFQIPPAVVAQALLAKGRDYFTYDKKNKTFSKNPKCPKETMDELRKLMEKTKEENEALIKKIARFISEKTDTLVDETEYTRISTAVSEYLIDHANDTYAELISEFLVKEEVDSPAVQQIQSIKEGNILLEGLSQNITSRNIQDNFNAPLTLYLETEILFHICGLNGEEYRRIGQDFLNTVNEINSKSTSKKPIIKLRYFSETYTDVERYFGAARSVVDKGVIQPQSGVAMRNIVNQCEESWDVDILKDKIIKQLSDYGITVDSETNYKPYNESTKQLNLEGADEIERLQNEFEEKWSTTELEDSLRLINYVNSKRNNVRRDRGYLKIGHLMITGKGVTFAVDSYLSKDEKIRPRNGAHFVTSIERITNYLWMSLNKNLISDSNLPSSMNVVVHAQTFISRKLEGKLHSLYEQLNRDSDEGKIDDSTTRSIAARLYMFEHNPENITSETIESVSRVLSLNSINEYRNMIKKDHTERAELEDKINALEQSNKNSEHQVRQTAEQNDLLKTENAQLHQQIEAANEDKAQKDKTIEEYQTEIKRYKIEEMARELRKKKHIRYTIIAGGIVVLVLIALWILWIFNQVKADKSFSWTGNIWNIIISVLSSVLATTIVCAYVNTSNKIKQLKESESEGTLET